MINEKAIIIKGLSKEYYKKDSSQKGFLDKLKPNKSGQSFYALKDINLEINKGEVIGIIGPNGAGKSTLLKVLAEVTPPTSGSVEIFGKVASILEIGIGFQPELSGYENIFLSGKLYGLSKKQIISKLDKIIEMFGFPDFIDTEVKHYSSGMYMRLAFSIIINIEADIYLFDEILSVGDAAFQGKALKEIIKLKNDEKTVLIVTHAPNVFFNICNTFISLTNGEFIRYLSVDEFVRESTKERIAMTPNEVIQKQTLSNSEVRKHLSISSKTLDSIIEIESISWQTIEEENDEKLLLIQIDFILHATEKFKPIISIALKDEKETIITNFDAILDQKTLIKAQKVAFKLNTKYLYNKYYLLDIYTGVDNFYNNFYINIIKFKGFKSNKLGVIDLPYKYEI